MEVALDGALHVFRERGYHAASLADLGSAMNLTPGSIYKAFSDKRAIFLAAFDRYVDLRNAALRPLLEAETTGHDKIAAMLRFYAESSCGDEGRRGCLVAGSAMGWPATTPTWRFVPRRRCSMSRQACGACCCSGRPTAPFRATSMRTP